MRFSRLWLIDAMLFHMLRKTIRLSARIRTLRTLERFVPRVYLDVRFQRRTLFKGTFAHMAFIGSFIAVGFYMFHQMAALDKRMSAFGA